jgi:pimeloyl-ACP methyl ester carboxylesterase
VIDAARARPLLHYREAGRGPALVLLMGTGADHTSWARQFGPLSTRFRVVAPDNRGAGKSALATPATETVADFAADVLVLLDALKIDGFHVAGYSFGAAIATALTEIAGARALSASFHSGWAGPNPTTTASLRRSLEAVEKGGVEGFLRAACTRNFSPTFRESDPAKWEAFLANVLRSAGRPTLEGLLLQIRAALAFDGRSALAAYRGPALVTTGERDPLAPPDVAREIAALLPRGALRIFEGPRAYHAIPLEMADAFNAELVAFHGAAT